MKTAIFWIIVMVSSLVMAQTMQAPIIVGMSDQSNVYARTFCLQGRLFAVATQTRTGNSNGAGGVALIQVLGLHGRPMDCK